MPFVARWPAAWPEGLVYDRPVSTLDLLPTALAIAGEHPDLEIPELDGLDLTPFVNAPDLPGPHPVLHWSRKDYFVVRDGDLKLVVTTREQPMVELFDIRVDPTEDRNIASQRPADVLRLLAMHEKWNGRNVDPRWGRSTARAR